MSQGLQIWDAAGGVVLEVTDRMGLFIGQVNTGTSSGSFADAALATGEPFVYGVPTSANWEATGTLPSVSVSGTTISWVFSTEAVAQPATILYGVF